MQRMRTFGFMKRVGEVLAAFESGLANTGGGGGKCLACSRQARGIVAEDAILAHAILQAGEIGFQEGIASRGQPVNHQITRALGFDDPVAL